jgi:SAM-dependent methyltransferase
MMASIPLQSSSAVVPPRARAFLADLARSGTALELGIGTGRLALPLSQRGIRVHGIELSPAMAARLRAKPAADGIGMTIGNFATAKVSATFGLTCLVRNTIMNLELGGPDAAERRRESLELGVRHPVVVRDDAAEAVVGVTVHAGGRVCAVGPAGTRCAAAVGHQVDKPDY